MNTALLELTARLLKDRGFRRVAGGFQRGDLSAALSPGWIRFEMQSQAGSNDSDPLTLARSGLWKRIGRHRHVADLRWGAELDGEESPPAALATAIDWVLACHQGYPSAEWAPPKAEILAQWLPPAARILRYNDILKAIELVSGPTLTLSCLLSGTPLEESPEVHQAWVRAVLQEWQSIWRMVRIRNTEQKCLVAEVDLTGAPSESTEFLLLAGVECLRAALPTVIPVLEILLSPGLELTCLDIPFPRHRVMAGASPSQTTITEEPNADNIGARPIHSGRCGTQNGPGIPDIHGGGRAVLRKRVSASRQRPMGTAE